MKILNIIAQKPFSTGSGVYLLGLVKALEMQNIENKIICGLSTEDDFSNIKNQLTSEILPVYYETYDLPFPVLGMSDVMPYKATKYSDLTIDMKNMFESKFLKVIDRAISTFKPDIILCQHLYLLTAIVKNTYPKMKVYGFCHGSDLRQIESNEKYRDYIKNGISKLDGIFSLHEEMSIKICSIFNIDKTKVINIGTGFSEDVFFYDESLHKKRCDKNIIKLVFTGKLSRAKGVFELVKAVDILQSKIKERIELILIGGSSSEKEEKELNKLITESKVKIIKTGILKQNEIAKIYNSSDIFVLPSYFEGLPLVIPEAISCGMKVISSDLVGIKEWKNLFKDRLKTIELPRLKNIDEPYEEDLPQYIENLSEAIKNTINSQSENNNLLEFEDNINNLTWKGLANRVLSTFK